MTSEIDWRVYQKGENSVWTCINKAIRLGLKDWSDSSNWIWSIEQVIHVFQIYEVLYWLVTVAIE